PGERLGDQPGADDRTVRPLEKAPFSLLGKDGLADDPEHRGVEPATDDDGETEELETRRERTGHERVPPLRRHAMSRMATSATSISLMPTNGTSTPPRPQISRFRRRMAS